MNPAPSHRVGGRLQEPPPAAVQVPPVAPAAPTAPEIVEAPGGGHVGCPRKGWKLVNLEYHSIFFDGKKHSNVIGTSLKYM